MGKLIYFTPTSLDGFIADETGNLDWSAPDEEVFALITDLERPGSGKRPTRSSIPNRSRPSLHRRRVSSGNSIRRWFAT